MNLPYYVEFAHRRNMPYEERMRYIRAATHIALLASTNLTLAD